MGIAPVFRNSRLTIHEQRTSLSRAALERAPFLISFCVLFAALLLTGCGDKKTTARRLPPPPTVGIEADSDSDSDERREPASKAEAEDELDAQLSRYRNAKTIWSETGYASWYGPPYHNQRGANGEVYNMHAMTAAHKTLPMNSIVRVTNLKTNQKAIVRITDRGPFVGDRVIDLSLAAAKALDVWRPGTAQVRVEALETPSPIETGGRWCVQVGAFAKQSEAIKLKERLQRRYHTAKVLQFAGPTGYWVRVRVLDDNKNRAQEVAKVIDVNEGGVFLVRLD